MNRGFNDSAAKRRSPVRGRWRRSHTLCSHLAVSDDFQRKSNRAALFVTGLLALPQSSKKLAESCAQTMSTCHDAYVPNTASSGARALLAAAALVRYCGKNGGAAPLREEPPSCCPIRSAQLARPLDDHVVGARAAAELQDKTVPEESARKQRKHADVASRSAPQQPTCLSSCAGGFGRALFFLF